MEIAGSILILLLLLLPILVILLDSSLRLIYCLVVLFHQPESSKRTVTPNLLRSQMKVLFLFPVRNEEKIIGDSILELKKTLTGQEITSIIVIADHCSDNTEEIACLAGAQVVSRSTGLAGKGPSLSWFVENYSDHINTFDIIILLDADSRVDKDFKRHIVESFSEGVEVVQSFIQPVNFSANNFSILASYSELLSQYLDDNARSILFWPIPLRGTGMAFRPAIFNTICLGLLTQVDDIELSIRLAVKGISVVFQPHAIVYDPKSPQLLGLARQRGRWLKGQRHIVSIMEKDLLKLVRAISGWSLIQALLFKPKTLIVCIKAILIFMFCSSSFMPLRPVLLFGLLVSLFIDFGYYFCGLLYVTNAKIYLSALLKTPLYFVLWLTGWFFSILPSPEWLRSRE